MKINVQRILFSVLLPALCHLSGLYGQTTEPPQEQPGIAEQPPSSDSLLLYQADSLEREALRLEERLEQLDTLSETEQDSGISHEIARIRDKMVTLSRKISSKVTHAISPAAPEEVEIESPEEQPKEKVYITVDEPEPEHKKGSGAFCLSFEYTSFDVDPLEYLAKHDRSLADIPISFSDNQMLTLGLTGYYSRDNSVRLGNGLYIGYKSFSSDIYSRPIDESDTAALADSLVTLRVIPVYFGFLCEKAFRYQPVDFFAGVMIGGHMTVVVKEEESAEMMSSFLGEDNSGDNDDSRYSVALSPAIFWDIHGGLSLALSESIHLGIEGIARFAYAYEGFGAGFGDYLTVSPGIRMRLSFGKAG